MKWLRGVVAAAVLVMVAAPAVGQTDSRTVNYVNPGNVVSDRYYVGPYSLQYPGGSIFDAYCVDFFHHVERSWDARITSLNDGSLAGRSRYGLATGGGLLEVRSAYSQAAYLAQQFKNPEVSTDDWGNIHAAIWYIMSDGQSANSYAGDYAYWLHVARSASDPNGMAPVNLANWHVITDVDVTDLSSALTYYNGTSQEFLVHSNVVPEPATLILMGTGLIAVAGMTIVMRQSVG